ncbi:MAG: 3-hydroxyacyl-CoA dehydrogenase NAD-binding domain-containing protein [Chthoniobacteraceae bacterium]
MNEPSNIQRETHRDGVCVVTFDRPGTSANVFDRAALLELGAHLDAIAADTAIRAVVFVSAKPAIFIAGADLHAISSLSDDALRELVELGQGTFTRISSLKVPTVAAIHGACLGGGCELALACDYRIATPDRATKIGLPETQLGILPAWGGSTRLPRLIGVRHALDIILAGKSLAAQQAIRCGLIDEIAPREALLRASRLALKRGLPRRAWVPLRGMFARLIAPFVRAKVRRKTRGHYPAVEKALDVVVAGAGGSLAKSFARERAALVELARTDAARNLVRLFFQQESAKKRTIEGAPPVTEKVRTTAVIGAGVMGAAIAQWLSARGLRVILRDIDPARVAAGVATIAKLYAAGVKRHVFTKVEARDGVDRIQPTVGEVPLQPASVVIEAVVEKIEVKQKVITGLARHMAPHMIVATNTSALPITFLAGNLPDPTRLVGIHFFNPVHQMQLVEVVLGGKTSPEVAQRATAFVQQIGKLPVIVRDRPGFVVNRILLPYLVEAVRLFERGAPIAEIDEAMLDFGMPMGPLRLVDEVGIDIAADVATTLAGHFPDRMTVPPLLAKMIADGLLGRKSGRGFYLHAGDTKPNPAVGSSGSASIARAELQRRMSLQMVAEAARCLEEKVAETAADIDFAMVMGTGFAPFRGGPLRFADSAGLKAIVDDLRQFEIAPCALLERMAAEGRKFHED